MSSAAPPRLGDNNATVSVSPPGSMAMRQAHDGYNHAPAQFTSRDTTTHGEMIPPTNNVAAERQEDFDSPGQEQNDGSSGSDEPTKKRRRSRKGLGKRFECPTEGCGKSYSRAEHLYRHQLNHSSKQVFRCEYPDCPRTFVRGDLLKRHMDRHAAKGPQLGRRDSIVGHLAQTDAMAPEALRPDTAFGAVPSAPLQYQSPQDQSGSPYTPLTSTPPAAHPNGAPSVSVAEGYGHQVAFDHHGSNSLSHRPSTAPHRPSIQTAFSYGSFPQQGAKQPEFHHGHPNVTSHAPAAFVPQQSVMPIQLPPAQYPHAQSEDAPSGQSQAYTAATSAEYADSTHRQSAEMMVLDQMAMSGTGPVFGDDGALSKSPYVGMPEDFMAYLFNSLPNTDSPASQTLPASSSKYTTADDSLDKRSTLANTSYSYGDLQGPQYPAAYLGGENTSMGYFPAAPQQIMAVNNLLDQNAPEASISEEKSQELFDLIRNRFHENDLPPAERQRDSIVGGDRTNGNHVLSRRMMQAYISSYWYHFSDQMPILHKPTFCSDKTPNLLLLAMMTIGAACLNRTHDQQVMKVGAKIPNFLARHLRWEIFMDWNFRPPAKLWVFQALILLELYEKMYSTRELHERAHIHHATTITLMRRGRSLIGKSSLDSPPTNPRDGQNGSHHSSTGGATQTPDEWWSHWITSEATRRAAFAAFIVDTTHATMFGHSGVMVAHEMRLALPCDESLWRATSSAEVARVESNLSAQGIKPMSFLEGLKRTLSHQEMRTTSFGRTVLMAGLLSVTYHMHQRDLQVNILGGGVTHALGGRDKWRATLTRAYDSWKADFDKALAQSKPSSDPYRHDAAKHEFNIVFASRTVLHHLAHMAMHADIVDCQIFARAKRLLGRSIGPHELHGAERRIQEFWAHTARARDATFYALKFLCSVLLPGADGGPHVPGQYPDKPYEARFDVLMNRPWVLYFAALVVWCYGFALEGPCSETAKPLLPHEAHHEMRNYLLRYGSIADPNELHAMRGLNNNTALLVVLKDSFEDTRWDLLHEAANLLRNCIVLNTGGAIM